MIFFPSPELLIRFPNKSQTDKNNKDKTDSDQILTEEKLFECKKKKYQKDPEADSGFPEETKEFEAKECLKDVLEEFSNNQRGRPLKPLKRGIGLILHGDPDFFDDENS